jgi:hypothetical protein
MELSGKGGFLRWTSDPYVPPAEKVIGWKHQILAVSVDGSVSRQLTKADDGGTQPSNLRLAGRPKGIQRAMW